MDLNKWLSNKCSDPLEEKIAPKIAAKSAIVKVQTHRTRFDNATRFSLTDNFDPSLNFPNI
jgi:hypothetical protein